MSILAWRYWWTYNKNSTLLGSNAQSWLINEPMHARHTYMYSGNSKKEHNLVAWHGYGESPVAHCTCGIYALKFLSEYDHVWNYCSSFTQILGVVEIWGKIITAEHGYRAEYAQIRALVDSPGNVATRYSVPNLPSVEYAQREYFK